MAASMGEVRARLVVGVDAGARLAAAGEWLERWPRDAEVLVVGATWVAVDDLVRAAALRAGARFGTIRQTLDRLAAHLALPALGDAGRTPAGTLPLVAVAARAAHRLLAAGRLDHFAPVAKRPGFPTAAAHTLAELRMNRVPAAALRRLPDGGPDLAALAEEVERELVAVALADRAMVYAAAAEAVEAAPHPVGLPLLLLDVPASSGLERALVAALAQRAPGVLATAPVGDVRAIALLEEALACPPERLDAPAVPRSLGALKAHLFEESTPPPAALDESVVLRSWPGEARECVEIVRAIQAEAAAGVPFDEMAVLLRSPVEYRPHLEEALRRADIPAHFARGTTRPDPAGRALLALLACASESLSARRFAEYVSLAQVPDPDRPRDPDREWAPPDDALVPVPALAETAATADDEGLPADPDDAAVVGGTLQAPWRWEQLLVDASVIGRKERWHRRLEGLAQELDERRRQLEDDEARAALVERQLRDLAHLRAFALPLLDALDALPDRATWGEWLRRLRALAATALRAPAGVLAALAELDPMAPVGPVDLDEVQLVLGPRLRELAVAAPRRRHGGVFVAPAEAARGLAFDVVFVPGLAEKLFPRRILEDPLLADAARRRLDVPALATAPARVASERLALRLAAGAARHRLVLSFPRLHVEQARPRVPSFYGLEALRAAEGTLPGFDELGARAEGAARLGWPAPERPEEAIDEAEYDLALLAPLLAAAPDTVTGTASYLLTANPHLARALRARARRWLRRWTVADGLVDPDPLAREALARHQLAARSFSPTALQHYAACPYRFFLQAVHRLAPREEPVAVEILDPLTRGAIFHDVQFAVLSRLRGEGRLPLATESLPLALATADAALDDTARHYEERLAPAIPRVWEDGIGTIRADLHGWLRREAERTDGWVPRHFELAFGLADRDRPLADPASSPEPVAVVGGLSLRGSIDLVEHHPRGTLRATDHKTGRAWVKEGVVVGGGEVLQPLLYALASERLLGEPVAAGRLYYCSADGGYAERVVRLDGDTRAATATVVETIGGALAEGFLPAAPTPGACGRCDYRPVCGPYEQERTARKPPDRLAPLARLRSLP